jgi:inward rectifier potassium channel
MASSQPNLPVERRNVRRAILSDLYHSLIARPWLNLLGLLVGVYLTVNLVFTGLYMLGGDCIIGAHRFIDYYFFSVQTLSTIGYGTMVPGTYYAHAIVTAQAFSGILFIAITTGLVFAKFSRPTARVMWSQKAVIFHRGNRRLLQFRLANERANQIVEARVRVALARNETTEDGERLRRFYDLKLERESSILFVLSWTVIHEIDAHSPLHGASHDDLVKQSAQLICSVVGTDETFSQQVHSRFAYSPEDIVYDQRFADIIGNNPDGTRFVDYARFHDVVPIGTKTGAP